MRIADIGTGTGILLTDLAAKLPKSVQLDEVPEHLIGAYDLVSVRHFAFVLQEHELQSAVKNLFRLLKPGGYLQWIDVDVSSQRIEKARPEINGEPQERIMNLFRGNDTRLSSAWVPSLSSRFSGAGLINVEVDQRNTPHYIGQQLFESGFLAVEALTRNNHLDDDKAREIEDIFRDSARVTRQGSYAGLTRYTVIGQKGL
ncbi:hypothetical protein BO78DRAFT_431345 [Aspergillus sclerotiicarbonarius CBS 121057]|uniref:S-adenosyl-L-methionine-dependent methyltransferase n=1 Tax=Aspergillus sclerotiicarbonarius (strain CBS 121057 / IBT 28362) TaxID=1448318 RepID=A0A319FDF8_ASPSB|nr:hypothetical protein BO78DRAFT_431345 [Aspergillus sclerotiicarbonarius CBS 121057]